MDIETSGFAGVDSGMSLSADAAVASVTQFDPLDMESQPSQLFFKVVRAVPSQRPINCSSAAEGVDSQDIAIVVGRCEMLDLEGGEAAVGVLDASATNSIMTWRLPSDFELNTFRSFEYEWQATGQIKGVVRDQRMVDNIDEYHEHVLSACP